MEVVARAAVVFFFLWILTRATGKRVLTELSAFELILMVTIGDLVQQGVMQEDMSVTGALLAVSTIGLLVSVFSYASYRWSRAAPLIEGLPVVVMRDGEMLREAMKLERITDQELREEAREQGIDSLSRIRLAVLEPDGKFSFITGEQHQQPEQSPAG